MGRRFFRFLLVGVLNTFFGLAVFGGLTFAGLPVWFSLIGSNAAGVIFNFFSTGGMVFRDTALVRLPRFIVVYALIYVLNLALIRGLTLITGHPVISQTILAFPLAFVSYLLFRSFVYSGRSDGKVTA